MANCKRELIYSCSDDCKMSGCPTHKATLNYQSVSDAYHFNANGRDYYFERGQLQAFIDLLKALNRVDSIQIK